MLNYLNSFITETSKMSFETPIEVDGPSGVNHMTVQTIVDHIMVAPKHEQKQIRNIMVQIDFRNGDMMHFFNHLAKAIAI